MRRTPVIQIDPEQPDPEAIGRAAEILRAGGLVAFPTETVYGLGADATNERAVRRIFEAKGRPACDPLIVHLTGPEGVAAVAGAEPAALRPLAAAFWPGPLTLIVPRGEAIPANVSAGRDTVALRAPHHPAALALIRAAGVPLAAPSANLFSRPSPTRAEHVLEDLDGRLDLVLDAGSTPLGVESTVLDLTADPPELLRPGGVPLERLRAALGEVHYHRREAGETEAQSAPGMMLKHYSPRTAVELVGGGVEALAVIARRRLAAGDRLGVLLFDEDREALADLRVELASLGKRRSPQEAAARLFDELRRLDRLGLDVILVRPPDKQGLGLAVWDRLYRAAQGREAARD